MSDDLIRPHGGRLVDLLVGTERAQELAERATHWQSWELSKRQLCDLELLLSGAFSPLQGFLGRSDYESVCASMRLADGTLWPIPVMLDVPESIVGHLGDESLALRDPEGALLAVLHVQEIWRPDRTAEARMVLGTDDDAHPGAAYLQHETHPWYVSGILEGVQPPVHYDFRQLRHTPAELRAALARKGWRSVVAFQTRNPLHRAHLELTMRATSETHAKLLIHPVIGMTRPGDIDAYTRVRCYQAVMPSYPPGTAMLSLLPLAMRMGGPREALWHAIIRKNHGASHLIVGRDHAGPGTDPTGRPFYPRYGAQELLQRHEDELGVHTVPYREMVYVVEYEGYAPNDAIPAGAHTLHLSGTEQRRLLSQGQRLPSWFTPPKVAEELYRQHPPRSARDLLSSLPDFPARASRRSPTSWSSSCSSSVVGGSHSSMAIWYASTSRLGSVTRRRTVTATSAGSDLWLRKSPSTAGSPSAPRSRPTTLPGGKCGPWWKAAAASCLCTSPHLWRSARHETERDSTPRPVRDCSPRSPVSRIPMNRLPMPILSST
jgi:sulfate adenylyltransferase